MNVPGIIVSIVGLFLVLPQAYMYWFSPEKYALFLKGQNKIARRQVIYALYKPWFHFLRRNTWFGVWMGRIVSLFILVVILLMLSASIWGPFEY